MTATSISQQRLHVTWRNPASGRIVPVGLLVEYCIDGMPSYSFAYLQVVRSLDGFRPLPGFPRLDIRYDSTDLFPLFTNRLMQPRRPDYDEYLRRLDLDDDTEPFELLGRSEGIRTTDRLEVFAEPTATTDGRIEFLFFVRGIRHLEDAEDAVDELAAGDGLSIHKDPQNPINPRAFQLAGPSDHRIGWLPDYLVEEIHELRKLNGENPIVVVEHLNGRDTAPHMRVLCRLSTPWPRGYEPFSRPEFQPIVPLDQPSDRMVLTA